MVGHLSIINKENYNFIKGQYVECPGLGVCRYVRDLYALTCIVEHNGHERSVSKYNLQKVDENSFFMYYRKYFAGDIIKYENIFGEVSKCDIGGIKLHLNNNIEDDITLSVTTQGIRLIMHPSINKTYWANDNDKLRILTYSKTEKDKNGIWIVGKDEKGNEIKLHPSTFLSSNYMVLKKDITLLKRIYEKISKLNVLISSNPSQFSKLNDPFKKIDSPQEGDIIRIGTKHYVFISMEDGKMVCKKLSTQKQQLEISYENIEIVARPNDNMFYKDKNKYYYFDGFRVVGSHLQIAGVIIERSKCKPSYVDIRKISMNTMEVCSEKAFWEHCKDKVGYIIYRFKIN